MLLSAVGCSSSEPRADAPRATEDAGTEPSDGASSGCATGVSAEPGVVVTDSGAVRGAKAGTTWAYKNVPYAAPPVGALRWKPPEAPSCWSGIRDATTFGPMCPQSDSTGTAPVTGDEDCLQLNVWTPEDAGATPLPVLFWIHGGGFTGGSAVEQQAGVALYDGQALAEKTHAVVVTTNYRVGVLGFLAHPALAGEADDGATGNYGLLDQIAALRFVQRNVRAFGGDPAHVTIAGESAGGESVCLLVASKLTSGLFQGAIMESGGCKANTLADAETYGAKVVQAAHCDTASDVPACLRAVPATDMVNALPVTIDVAGITGPYGGVIDQSFLAGAPSAVITSGAHQHVPMIVGSNSDETSRTVPIQQDATEAAYEAAVKALFGALAPAVLTHYPASNYASPWAAYVAVTSDAKFTCGARRIIRALRKGQTEPVFRYFFTHGLASAPRNQALGAWHGIDVLFVFDHLALAGYVPSAGEQTLSDSIGAYWSSFAASATPSAASSPTWPPSDDADAYLELATPSQLGAGVRTEQCNFWDTLAL